MSKHERYFGYFMVSLIVGIILFTIGTGIVDIFKGDYEFLGGSGARGAAFSEFLDPDY